MTNFDRPIADLNNKKQQIVQQIERIVNVGTDAPTQQRDYYKMVEILRQYNEAIDVLISYQKHI
jgi:hypothetical protein